MVMRCEFSVQLLLGLVVYCFLSKIVLAQLSVQERFAEIFRIPKHFPVSRNQRVTKNRIYSSKENVDEECENLDKSALIRRLKDEGDYNPTYMASSIPEAASRFEDLSDRRYMPAFSPKPCDDDCRGTIDEYIETLKSINKLPPEDQIELRPDLSNARPKMSNAALAQYHRNVRLYDQSRPFFGGRGKRSGGFSASVPSSMLDDEDVGQTSAVYCWKAGDQGLDKNKNLHHLCTACRSIKVLSDMHFPRYLNQVECRGGECLRGAGICAKQYIVVNVLKNTGTKKCQRWTKEHIKLSVCCDCMLKKESYLYHQMTQKRIDL